MPFSTPWRAIGFYFLRLTGALAKATLSVMRKTITGAANAASTAPQTPDEYINIESLARVEITSEDPEWPVENALALGSNGGWRAARGGAQTLRLFFDEPVAVKTISLEFGGGDRERTQEFRLEWSPTEQGPGGEIVRQQYNFSPGGAARERENYQVEIPALRRLDLTIIPEISDPIGADPDGARVWLLAMRLA